jgi:hypothetical protein
VTSSELVVGWLVAPVIVLLSSPVTSLVDDSDASVDGRVNVVMLTIFSVELSERLLAVICIVHVVGGLAEVVALVAIIVVLREVVVVVVWCASLAEVRRGVVIVALAVGSVKTGTSHETGHT